MANLFFPQLSTGTLAQYPIKKTRITRTVKNVLSDGSVIAYPDPYGSQLVWQFSFSGLSDQDTAALEDHYSACNGPLRAFTFIDPTENMITASSDLSNAVWLGTGGVRLTTGIADPVGGVAANTISNVAQVAQTITQSLEVPSGYHYCLSAYVRCDASGIVSLSRSGASAANTSSFAVGPNWTRIVSSGALADTGIGLTVGLTLGVGEQFDLYGIQLEGQIAPSRYRPTVQAGGLYPAAHWASESLDITAEGPNAFGASFAVETGVRS